MFYRSIDNAGELRDLFIDCNRDYYSIEGYQAMLDLTEECGDMELDIIGLCCDFNEDTKQDILNNYGYMMTEEEKASDDAILEFLNYHTYAVLLNNGNFFYQAF